VNIFYDFVTNDSKILFRIFVCSTEKKFMFALNPTDYRCREATPNYYAGS